MHSFPCKHPIPNTPHLRAWMMMILWSSQSFFRSSLVNPLLCYQKFQLQNFKRRKVEREWSAPIWFQTYKDFEKEKSGLTGRFMHKGTNKVTCDICPTNPFLHNMSRAYFKCDNVECEVEEADCLCLKGCAELKTAQRQVEPE